MKFIDQNSCFYSWVLIHDLFYFFDRSIENSHIYIIAPSICKENAALGCSAKNT